MNNERIISSFKSIFESTAYHHEHHEFPYEIFQTPFCNITLDTAAFQQIWLQIFPFFMNTNVNALDLVVSTQEKVVKAFLIKATQEGLLEELIFVDKQDIPHEIFTKIKEETGIEKGNFSLSAKVHEKIASKINKKYKTSLGNVRIYSQDFFSKFMEIYHSGVSQKKDFIETLSNYFLLFLAARKELDLNGLYFDSFPATDFTRFLDGSGNLLKNTDIMAIKDNLVKILKDYIPHKKYSISFQTERHIFSFMIDSRGSSISIRYLPMNPALNAEIADKFTRRREYLKVLRRMHHIKQNFLVELDSLLNLFGIVLQSPFPLSHKRMEYILQHILNFYRSYGFNWEVAPKPIIMNEAIRYWQYTFGIRLNLRKIAYWFVPNFLISTIFEPIGTDGKILLISGKNFGTLSKSGEFKNNMDFMGFLCQFESNQLVSIKIITNEELARHSTPLNPQVLPSGDENEQKVKGKPKKVNGNSELCEVLDTISLNLQQNLLSEYGLIHGFYWISTDLIRVFVQTLQFSIFSPFSRYWAHLKHLIKCCQKAEYLWFTPKNREFRFLLASRPGKYLKLLLPLIIDQHEF